MKWMTSPGNGHKFFEIFLQTWQFRLWNWYESDEFRYFNRNYRRPWV